MKKVISIILCLVMISALVVGCGGSKESATKSADKKLVLRIATSNTNNPNHPSIQHLLTFKQELEKRLGDKVQVRIFYGGQLGKSANDVIGGLQHGSFEMATWALGNFGEYSKAFDIMDVPYLFLNEDIVYKFVDGPIGEAMKQQLLKDTNIKLLAYTPLGFRHFTTGKKPITSVEDLSGLKIRTMTSKLQMAGVKQLGAAPTPIPYSEVFTSLQQGVIDGQENPIMNIYDSKFYEVQKYMTLTNHNFTFTSLLMDNKFFEKLSPDIQKAILESNSIADKQARKTLADKEDEILKKLGEKMQITKLNIEELKKFKQVAQGCWPEAKAKIGEATFNKAVTEVEKIEKQLGL
jgi:tripartite ATP-independent transporter DctP family solute receptor